MTPVAGSFQSTRSMRRDASGVPSQTITIPECCEKPIPTPPPWCRDTQVAPDALLCHVEPVVQVLVVRQQLLHLGVGPVDVLRIARERRPAERPDAAAEQGPDISRHEARKREGVVHAFLLRHLP